MQATAIIYLNPEYSLGCVIIPMFNVRPYLASALDGVLQQTYETLAVITFDDGSIDGSGEIGNQLTF